MATLTQTIDLSLAWVGSGERELWGVMDWGTGYWGENSIAWWMNKGISPSVSPTMSVGKSIHHLVDFGELAPTSTVGKRPSKVFANSVVASGVNASERRMSGIYDYVYPANVTNLENRTFTEWTSQAAASTSWAAASTPSTDWSEA